MEGVAVATAGGVRPSQGHPEAVGRAQEPCGSDALAGYVARTVSVMAASGAASRSRAWLPPRGTVSKAGSTKSWHTGRAVGVFVAVVVGGTAALVVVAVGGTRLVDIRIQPQRARDRVGRHGQAEAVAGVGDEDAPLVVRAADNRCAIAPDRDDAAAQPAVRARSDGGKVPICAGTLALWLKSVTEVAPHSLQSAVPSAVKSTGDEGVFRPPRSIPPAFCTSGAAGAIAAALNCVAGALVVSTVVGEAGLTVTGTPPA